MGEVVLITGCSRGIGLGLVDCFAKAGFKVKSIIVQFMTQLSCSCHAFYEQAFPMFGVILGDDIDHVPPF